MECESGRDRISPNDFRMLRYVQCLPVFQRKLINNTHIYSSRSLANRVLHGQVERTSPKTLTEEQCLFVSFRFRNEIAGFRIGVAKAKGPRNFSERGGSLI